MTLTLLPPRDFFRSLLDTSPLDSEDGGVMPWVKTDDNAASHPKFFRAGVCAFGWWSAALGYCNRYLTDGFIPARDVFLIYPGTPDTQVMELVGILVHEGLLEVRVDGWQMHDFLDYQPSRNAIQKQRRMKLSAARKGGESNKKRIEALRLATSLATSASSRPDPTRPVPTEESRSTTAPVFQVPESVRDALKRAPRLGGCQRFHEGSFWQAELRANPGVDFAAEVLRAEAWIAANQGRAPRKDLPRFLHNWLSRAER